MADIEFNSNLFRQQFPEFANTTKYSDELLESYWDIAIEYVSNKNGCILKNGSRAYAINCMTAHITQLSQLPPGGSGTVIVMAVEGDIKVQLTPPPSTTAFEWWCNTTRYGQQLLALLYVRSVGGMYIAGRPPFPRFI